MDHEILIFKAHISILSSKLYKKREAENNQLLFFIRMG